MQAYITKRAAPYRLITFPNGVLMQSILHISQSTLCTNYTQEGHITSTLLTTSILAVPDFIKAKGRTTIQLYFNLNIIFPYFR
jgi:hypothetical protein